MEIKLSNILDVEALAKDYARKNRLQVRGLMTPDSAERIFECLVKETPWGLVYNNGDDVVELTKQQFDQLSPEQRQVLYRDVYIRAQSEYQYIYYYYPILSSYKSGQNQDFFLHRVLEFLNSEPVLDFARKLTGIPEIIKADGQATLYGQNTFLHWHMDEHSNQGWRAAYVLNFTKTWNPNWGGYLQFFDEEMNVEEALMPAFNAINIFTVPKRHSVSFVPLFVPGVRLSITGWFRDK